MKTNITKTVLLPLAAFFVGMGVMVYGAWRYLVARQPRPITIGAIIFWGGVTGMCVNIRNRT